MSISKSLAISIIPKTIPSVGKFTAVRMYPMWSAPWIAVTAATPTNEPKMAMRALDATSHSMRTALIVQGSVFVYKDWKGFESVGV